MWKVLKVLCWVVAPVGVAAYGPLLGSFFHPAFLRSAQCKLGLSGFFAGAVLWMLLGRFLRFFHVLEHELTHLLFGLLFFRKPKMIVASDEGGQTSLYGGNFVITLAPYFFPTLAAGLLLTLPLLKNTYMLFFCTLLGLFTGYHVISSIQDFSFHQPDIRQAGPAFSLVVCALGNIVALGYVLGILESGFPGGWLFLKRGLYEAAGLILCVKGLVTVKLYPLVARLWQEASTAG